MLNWSQLKDRANNDGEFLLHARHWNSVVRLGIGRSAQAVTINDGKIKDISAWFGLLACNVSIEAPETDWQAMLAPTPKPFYQDLYAAGIHHEFNTSGDIAHYCAYYPAIRRLIEIMREVNNG